MRITKLWNNMRAKAPVDRRRPAKRIGGARNCLSADSPAGSEECSHHHLLDRLAGLAVQIRQLGILRLDLLCVDLRLTLDHALPPVHFVHLLKSDIDLLAIACSIRADPYNNEWQRENMLGPAAGQADCVMEAGQAG